MENKRNLLLLALSTLPKKPQRNTFKLQGSDLIIDDCISQLEPIVKLQILNDTEKIPLEVVELCTKKVKEVQDCDFPEGIEVKEVSTKVFFEKRIKEFGASKGVDVTFWPIDIEQSNPYPGIREVVDYIRQNKDSINEFWIDTHGGFREISLLVQAILSLLKMDECGIAPDRIYGVLYDEENKGKGENFIVDQRQIYSVFDFVAGMNEFNNYGSVQILDEYYTRLPNEELKGMLSAMNLISDGIQASNPNYYLEGLKNLGKEIDVIDHTGDLMGFFGNYIRHSYGKLLDSERVSTLDIIERCLNKGFIQQALTFLESLMPAEFYDRQIVYWTQEELDKYVTFIDANRKRIPKYERPYICRWLINRYILSDLNELPGARNGDNGGKSYIRNVISDESIILESNFFDSESQIASYQCEITHNTDEKYRFTYKTCVLNEHWHKVGAMLRLHRALKDARNLYNHCNSDRADMDQIKKALYIYVSLGKSLFEAYEKKLDHQRTDEMNKFRPNRSRNSSSSSRNASAHRSKKAPKTTASSIGRASLNGFILGDAIRKVINTGNEPVQHPISEECIGGSYIFIPQERTSKTAKTIKGKIIHNDNNNEVAYMKIKEFPDGDYQPYLGTKMRVTKDGRRPDGDAFFVKPLIEEKK